MSREGTNRNRNRFYLLAGWRRRVCGGMELDAGKATL